MAVKSIFAFCASVLLFQQFSANFSYCAGKLAAPYSFPGNGCSYNGLAAPAFEDFAAPGYAYESFAAPALAYERAGFGCGCAGVASTGGGLPVSSASLISPVGVSVLSENVYEGTLAAGGNLPFLGAVAIEGVVPSAGAGAVSYGCGNSRCAVGVEEGPIATGIAPYVPGPYNPFSGYAPAVPSYKSYAMTPYKAGCGCGAIF